MKPITKAAKTANPAPSVAVTTPPKIPPKIIKSLPLTLGVLYPSNQ